MTTLTTTAQAGRPASAPTDTGTDVRGVGAPPSRGTRSPGIRVDRLVVTAGGATVPASVSASAPGARTTTDMVERYACENGTYVNRVGSSVT
jgi:hypothetical protein